MSILTILLWVTVASGAGFALCGIINVLYLLAANGYEHTLKSFNQYWLIVTR